MSNIPFEAFVGDRVGGTLVSQFVEYIIDTVIAGHYIPAQGLVAVGVAE